MAPRASSGSRRTREPKNPLSCHDRALRLLAVRPRSRRELEVRLLRAGFDREEVQDELARLTEVGLLDDERFAADVVEHAVDVRRSGRRAIATALASKGIGRDTIERALSIVPGDEEARAEELARVRAPHLAGLAPEAAYRRLTSFLVRRGYSPEIARRAAARGLGADRAED